ncbi:NUDIX hydrolase [Rhabdothermincola sediminis]|uniref:NUDIX hydrolase n=1 Tax=Rhabdothermincola sediminis TaxID=2751370 RepID=UPI001AA0530B|nr:NUDIX domain-containing protein [Rhabdothermincola sediminis]
MGTVELRPAATIMLVRDGSEGLEVFMLRRNLRSDFVGGAYVFPGGAVDDHDRHENLEAVCAGRTDAEASAQLGVERGGLAFWVAAIRESFEEAGVLLAYGPDGAVVRLDDPGAGARFASHRRDVDRGARRLVDICAEEGLRLAVDGIFYFSHWITPEGAPRRYDTRFFVARAPDGQVPFHDDHEVIASLWVRPSEALARHRAGEFELIYPTMRSLVTLERFASADELLGAAAAIEEVPAIEPRIVEDEGGGGYRIVLPGDPGYDDVVPAVLPEGVPMNKLLVRREHVPVTEGGR